MRLALGLLTLTAMASAVETTVLRKETVGVSGHSTRCEAILDGKTCRFEIVQNFGGKFQTAKQVTAEVTDGIEATIALLITQQLSQRMSFSQGLSHTTYRAYGPTRPEGFVFIEDKPGKDLWVASNEAVALRNLLDTYCR